MPQTILGFLMMFVVEQEKTNRINIDEVINEIRILN